MAWGLLPGSKELHSQNQIWGVRGQDPSVGAGTAPVLRGQRTGPWGEQGPPTLMGSGQDPRMRAGTTPILGGQRPGPWGEQGPPPLWGQARTPGESRDHPSLWGQARTPGESRDPPPLWGTRSGAFSPQFAPRSHLPPSPHEASSGSWSPSSVPGGRCLATMGSSSGGEGHYAIPGAPARIEAMPQAGVGAVGQVVLSPGPALCLVRGFVLSTT